MTDQEKAIVLATQYAIRYDNCNPNVGMGPAKSWILEDILKELGLTKETVRFNIILEAL